MKRIAVTGASGKAGKWTVQDLREHGYDVKPIDRIAPADRYTHVQLADLSDFGHTIDTLAGCDAIVHHAAIPAPGIATDAVTFTNNTLGTFNVFQAASRLGIRRVVVASSETTLGLPLNEFPPAHVPLDESLPLNPRSAYAHSKQVGEETARYFASVAGITSVSLRFTNIMAPADYANFESWQDHPERRIWNLWGYVDVRDVAQSCRLGLTTRFTDDVTARAYIIAADDTVMRTPSAGLMARFLPTVAVRPLAHERATLLSIDLAKRELGYKPSHSWLTEPPASRLIV